MMRVLEFIVACIIVAVVGVVVGFIMPSSGHVERSLVVGKDMRQVYDVLNNFRRFPDYSVQRQYDRNTKYDFSGKAYGPGAEVSWTSEDDKVGSGKLTIASNDPTFDKVDLTVKSAKIVWNLDSNWRGKDKHFTLQLDRQGTRNQLTKITWSYDVAYGANLIDRYSNLYIHGDPDAFIQFTMNNLQNVLAQVSGSDYTKLIPAIEQTKPVPVLLVSTSADRKGGGDARKDAEDKAISQLQAAAKKLNVNVVGPRILITTNYGDQTYNFDVALPISASSLNVGGQSHDLTAPKPPSLADAAAPASSGTAAAPADAALAPGSLDRFNRLVVDGNVRAELAGGSQTLRGQWNGEFGGVAATREMLKAYAQTHGYKFDEVTSPSYDVIAKPEEKKGDDVTSYALYMVYLPITNGPDQTPEQEAGMKPETLDDAPASSGTAPAPASTAATAK
ncbi:polyketide cyclase [Dyella sp.]|uniref:polyketide cyclase n=1 Tax=Dyella sp. TaxID=1869338 RepID=UPI002ED3C8BE